VTTVELSDSQRRLLATLVAVAERTGSRVQSDALAAALDRSPGTVRNRMTDLKRIGVVDSHTGPQGGYEPTDAAYEALDWRDGTNHESVVLASGHERVDATVAAIEFTAVHHPGHCGAHVRFRESPGVEAGDAVVVGPTPVGSLAVAGTVDAVDHREATAHLDVTRVDAPVETE
jgi:predicted transcriptional regulator